jgi:hypothetical protein
VWGPDGSFGPFGTVVIVVGTGQEKPFAAAGEYDEAGTIIVR